MAAVGSSGRARFDDELIEFYLPYAGLGVSLLNPNARTLLERFGFERVDLELRRYDKAYESLAYRQLQFNGPKCR